MAFLLVLLALILFVIADVAIRRISRNMQEKRARREREEALAVNLRLDFSDEAKTLKRVEVKDPKASLLVVDDEEIVLDSFRKILVLDGYSIDTVENGPEALGLVRKRHYDFVFTDLKMPEMDGVEVCKAVKHLRPDIDVIIITGYASVESAVETMKFGAMDYLQKPFTEDELVEMIRKFVIRRQDRLKKQRKPQVRISHFTDVGISDEVTFFIPGGVFICPSHCWASIDPSGNVYVGMDDFARKIIGTIDALDMPETGGEVDKGQHLFSVTGGKRTISFKSPVGGEIMTLNTALVEDIGRLQETSYDDNWICLIRGANLETDLKGLKIGQGAVDLYYEEIEKLEKFAEDVLKTTENGAEAREEERLYSGLLGRVRDADFRKLMEEFFSGS